MIDIKLPRLHSKQQYIVNHSNKRNVLCVGRRGGKTTLLSALAAKWLISGHRVVYGTPVTKQLLTFWGNVKAYLRPLIASGYLYKSEVTHSIYWNHQGENGPGIFAQTAYSADNWRGDYGDKLVLDEYAYMFPDVWDKVGVPMLLDNDGDAWFISTPNRKNHFYNLFIRGKDPLDPRWTSFHFTSHDNPHLSKTALKEISEDMTQEDYDQEIDALFLENEGAVFRNIGANLHNKQTTLQDHFGTRYNPTTRQEEPYQHHIVCGVDWGKKQDYTVISIGCSDCRQEVYFDRFNQIDYTFQRDRLATAVKAWGVIDGLAEVNAMGEPNLEMLQLEGLPIRGFTTTATSKPPLIDNLRLSLERGEFQFLNIPIATAELEAYEMKVNPSTGRTQYSAPAGVHDDTVIARAIMLQAINSYMPALA